MDRVGDALLLDVELARGSARRVRGSQFGVVRDVVIGNDHTHKEQFVAEGTSLGVKTEVEVAHLEVLVCLVLVPSFKRNTLTRSTEELPNTDEGEHHHYERTVDDEPRQSDNPVQKVVDRTVCRFIIPEEQSTQ